jgi:hypothetical protein
VNVGCAPVGPSSSAGSWLGSLSWSGRAASEGQRPSVERLAWWRGATTRHRGRRTGMRCRTRVACDAPLSVLTEGGVLPGGPLAMVRPQIGAPDCDMNLLTLVIAAYAALVASASAVVQYLSRRDVVKRNLAVHIRVGRADRNAAAPWVVFVEVVNRGRSEVTVTNVRLRTMTDGDPPLVVNDETVRLDTGGRVNPSVALDEVLGRNGGDPYRLLKAHVTLADQSIFRSTPRPLINW